MSLQLAPLRQSLGGADGTTTQLALFGGSSEMRLQWWSESPRDWEAIVAMTAEMVALFETA
jgi:hypothetical protein